MIFGVGPDGVGGTADDVDVDFGDDVFVPNEGLTGIEETLVRTAFGLSRTGLRLVQPLPDRGRSLATTCERRPDRPCCQP